MKYLTPLVVHMHPMGIKQKLLQGIQDCTLSFHILCIKSIRTHTCIFTVGLTKQTHQIPHSHWRQGKCSPVFPGCTVCEPYKASLYNTALIGTETDTQRLRVSVGE